jgi:3-oxoacyl-[acyl-carrier-protein] synthase II
MEACMIGVAVTGMGCVTPIGNSVAAFWESLCAGRSGISTVQHFDPSQHEVRIAGEVRDLDPDAFGINGREARRVDRFALYALVAAAQALRDSGFLKSDYSELEGISPERVGVVIGTGIGGLGSIEDQAFNLVTKGPRRVSPTLVPAAVPDVGANEVALRYGLQGPSCAISTACSSGNDGIIYGARLIREGVVDVVVAGGSEATVTPISLATFGNLRALSRDKGDPTRVCRPFDKGRSGFVMGEGAGLLILESVEHARRRGAEILALLAGYGQTCDSYHRTAPDPEGRGAARAIRLALETAGFAPGDVDYINAHGTSTISNDPMETHAIKTALGDADARRVSISSTKSMTGHLIGAAGAVEAICCIQAIRNHIIPPTINLDEPDPACDLDYVPKEARQRRVHVALSNTFGFGGHNATVAFRAV